MDKIICIYKPQGITPGQFIKKFRIENPEYEKVKIGYAGRLDPLAHGVMILTVGEANKRRQEYLGLNKTYKFSVLFGIETDSYDYLGLLKSLQINEAPEDLGLRIKKFMTNNTGKFLQTYPPFSAKPVNGIPLYKLAKQNKISAKDLPAREVEIYKFVLEKIEILDSRAIKKIILKNLKKVKGHFRQTETLKLWIELFSANKDHRFKLASFVVECSSGTYVRSLAQRMGEDFGSGAIAFEIYRTTAGKYNIEDCVLCF